MKVYVATSWRNPDQPGVVALLRQEGHEVYDFRRPKEHVDERDQGFQWSDIDPDWSNWSRDQYCEALNHPLAEAGYKSDITALTEADAVVLVMPCGRSAHLELGYAVGAGKPTVILLSEDEPELMYKMATHLVGDLDEVVHVLELIADEGPQHPAAMGILDRP